MNAFPNPRQILRAEVGQGLQAEPREQSTCCATQDREQQAFGEQLADHLCRRTIEQQVGEVVHWINGCLDGWIVGSMETPTISRKASLVPISGGPSGRKRKASNMSATR